MKIRSVFNALVLAASCVALVSCGSAPETPSTSQSGSQPAISDIPSAASLLAKIDQKFWSDPNFRTCYARTVNTCNMTAARETAEAKNSTDICKEFSDPSLQKNCLEIVTSDAAKRKADPSLCDTLTDLKASCFAQATTSKASIKKDPTLCNAIPRSASEDPTVPPGLDLRDNCVLRAIQSLDPSESGSRYCGLIKTSEPKAACQEAVRKRAACSGSGTAVTR